MGLSSRLSYPIIFSQGRRANRDPPPPKRSSEGADGLNVTLFFLSFFHQGKIEKTRKERGKKCVFFFFWFLNVMHVLYNTYKVEEGRGVLRLIMMMLLIQADLMAAKIKAKASRKKRKKRKKKHNPTPPPRNLIGNIKSHLIKLRSIHSFSMFMYKYI